MGADAFDVNNTGNKHPKHFHRWLDNLVRHKIVGHLSSVCLKIFFENTTKCLRFYIRRDVFIILKILNKNF